MGVWEVGTELSGGGLGWGRFGSAALEMERIGGGLGWGRFGTWTNVSKPT